MYMLDSLPAGGATVVVLGIGKVVGAAIDCWFRYLMDNLSAGGANVVGIGIGRVVGATIDL